MTSKIFYTFIISLCIGITSFSQTKTYSDILPKDIKANPILDSTSYLPDSLRQIVFSTLKAKGFDLTKCFCDKEIGYNKKENSIEIRIWDIDDLKYRKKSEQSKKMLNLKAHIPISIQGHFIMTLAQRQ